MPSEIDEFLQHEEPSTLIGSSLYRKVEPGEIIFLKANPATRHTSFAAARFKSPPRT